MVRTVKSCELKHIVKIHFESLPGDYLPSLGRKILTQYYERYLDTNPIFAAVENAEILGFLAFSLNPVSIHSVLRDNLLSIALQLLKKPKLWFETIFLYLNSYKDNYFPEIAFIAVDKESRGLKIGTDLINHAAYYAKKNGFQRIYVKTDANNHHSNNFYKSNQFVKINAIKRWKKRFNVYRKSI